jgi:hypothetical protein
VQQELFLCDEVLHMNVDNLVESSGCAGVNSAKFNTMMQIAHFWCNARGSRRAAGKFFKRSDGGHSVVGRKTQMVSAKASLEGKTFASSWMRRKKSCETIA